MSVSWAQSRSMPHYGSEVRKDLRIAWFATGFAVVVAAVAVVCAVAGMWFWAAINVAHTFTAVMSARTSFKTTETWASLEGWEAGR